MTSAKKIISALLLCAMLAPTFSACGGGDTVDTAGDGEFAIALRCGLASGTRLRLFAGAGIMPDSDPDAELAETEAKMRPLLDALGV